MTEHKLIFLLDGIEQGTEMFSSQLLRSRAITALLNWYDAFQTREVGFTVKNGLDAVSSELTVWAVTGLQKS